MQQVFHTIGSNAACRSHYNHLCREDIATDLYDLQLQDSDPFLNNVDKLREDWLSNQIEEPIDDRFVEAKKEIIDIHTSLQQFVKKIDLD